MDRKHNSLLAYEEKLEMEMHTTKLQRNLNFKDVLILSFSTMIGWGWIVLTGSWITSGGTAGAVIAFAVGAILCIFVGIVYCELTTMLPYAGGEIVFSYKALGYEASWFTGWMVAFAYIGVAAWEGPALASALDYLISIPRIGYLYTVAEFDVYVSWLIIPCVIGVGITYMNYMGIKFSAKFQLIATSILTIGGILFAGISIIKGDVQNCRPFFTNSKGFFTVMLAVPAMFVGFDVIPQVTEEMKISIKKIPLAIIFSICCAAVWYIVIILTTSMAASKDILNEEGISVANAIIYETGNSMMGKLIIVTAIMGILTSWNGFIMGATRVLYSMGRAKMLPGVFGKLHTKYKTPYVSIFFVGFITILSPLLGQNSLSWFVNASSFGTVIAYLMVSISFVILRHKFPNEVRPYKIRHGLIFGCIAILISLFYVCLYLPIGPSSLGGEEWLIVLAWFLLGMIQYIALLKNRSCYKEERETAIYNKNQ